ncbi:Chromatin assembly factor 1 subunit A domain containing protein [Amanita muscaria]
MADAGINEEVQLVKGQMEVTHSTGENSSLSTGERQRLIELKNGRVTLKQKIILFEKQSETLQEIVKFREFLQSRIDSKDPPLSEIPGDHKPVIAKMAHESDKALGTLAKHIRQELLPTQGENAPDDSSSNFDALPQSVVEAAIKSVMNRNNYGLSLPNGGKAPAIVCLWRWEVKEEYWNWLPKGSREKAEQRLTERALARENLQILFTALPQEEQVAILNPKGVKTQAKIANKESSPPESSPSKSELGTDARTSGGQDGETSSIRVKGVRPKKALDPDKLAKDKERLDKKAAKDEKERKAKDAQNKSRSIMNSFFSKKVPAAKACTNDANKGGGDSSETQSEFARTFKPYLVKKDAQLAPTNWFVDSRSKLKGKSVPRKMREVITIDDDDDSIEEISMENPPLETFSVGAMSAKDRLQTILSSLTPRASLSQTRSPSYKTYHPISIRETMSQLAEAEVSGDDNLVRSLLAKLRDRAVFPAKAFIFHEDARPGYFGTWTRNSKAIDARTPLAKDLAGADYSYDSGEEWEDEGTADADDVLDDDDDELIDDEADSDLDNWLVDDDDVDMSPHTADLCPPELREPSPFDPPKRKVENEHRKSEKRRKVVVPLVPFAKGPCWESTIGNCDYDVFKAYKMRMFNGTPFPVDPFTWVEDQNTSLRNCGYNISDVRDKSTMSNCPSNNAPSIPPKKPAVAPKNAFPDAHVPFLLTKITALQAASLTFLVEAIYQELRVHKVKKNAVEAKVREVCEKCKEKRVWVVKSAFKV